MGNTIYDFFELDSKDISSSGLAKMKAAIAKMGKHLGDVDMELDGEHSSSTLHLYIADSPLDKGLLEELAGF